VYIRDAHDLNLLGYVDANSGFVSSYSVSKLLSSARVDAIDKEALLLLNSSYVVVIDENERLKQSSDIQSDDIFKGITFKGGPGSGHFGHEGREGKRGGSLPGSGSHYLPKEQRVWQGRQQQGKVLFNQNETGRRGEVIAAKAMEEMFGVEFSLMNVGLNNAPIDVAGDHHAVEVKTGPATNGRSAQQWRITTSYTSGPTEKALIAKMTPAEKAEYNTYKQQQSMARKLATVDEMSRMAGTEIKPVTIGVIMSSDGKRGDAFMIPGFHLRLGWNNYATEKYYIGTYDVGS
jgi:hypothetical protein